MRSGIPDLSPSTSPATTPVPAQTLGSNIGTWLELVSQLDPGTPNTPQQQGAQPQDILRLIASLVPSGPATKLIGGGPAAPATSSISSILGALGKVLRPHSGGQFGL